MKKEVELISSITHFVGFLLSIAALVILVVLASIYRTPWHVVSFAIFGTSLILLYSASMIYHVIPVSNRWKKRFQKIDHSMIYILIAGSYTPLCLVCLRGPFGWSLFGIIWGLAVLGIIWKSIFIKMKGWLGALSSIIYLVMGWLLIIAFIPLVKCLSFEGFLWLLVGGLFYSSGVIFFILDYFLKRKKAINMHDIFHIFVLLGSFCTFWLMLKYVLYI